MAGGAAIVRLSMRKWVRREDRVVEDHGLGLAAQEADLKLRPERVRVGLATAEAVEPTAGFLIMSKAIVGQGEEDPILLHAHPPSFLDSFVKTPNSFREPSDAIKSGAKGVQVIRSLVVHCPAYGELRQAKRLSEFGSLARKQNAPPSDAVGQARDRSPCETGRAFLPRAAQAVMVSGAQERQDLMRAGLEVIRIEHESLAVIGGSLGPGKLSRKAVATPGPEERCGILRFRGDDTGK